MERSPYQMGFSPVLIDGVQRKKDKEQKILT
jgi:hypothetical protein